LHLATGDGNHVRDLSTGMFNGRWAAWSPDSRRLLALGRADAGAETEFCVVPIDGTKAVETGLLRTWRDKGFNTQWAALAVSLRLESPPPAYG
jgi:hypothetical protein